jgi:hypothetical protein
MLICSEKPRLAPPVNRSRRKRIVVSVETTATTNITGFLERWRGLSFLRASPTAGMRMRLSRILADFNWLMDELQQEEGNG